MKVQVLLLALADFLQSNVRSVVFCCAVDLLCVRKLSSVWRGKL